MMKSIIILSLLFIGAFSLSIEYSLMKDLFQQWKQAHGKQYVSVSEEDSRFNTFISNYLAILEHRTKNDSAILGLNHFADLSSEEFGKIYTGALPKPTNGKTKVFNTQDIPTSWDWRKKGAVVAVRNQGSCGSGWAFSAVSALEGLFCINTTQLVKFSPQHFLDCVAEDQGCNGGWPIDALVYGAKYGLEVDMDYPYYGFKRPCSYNPSKATYINTGYYNVTVNSVPQLKAAIVQQPVTVFVQASQLVFQFYAGGVIKIGCGANVDHAVLAVGYDNINGNDAFVVKNSWGDLWGAQGFVYISADPEANQGQGVCGILTFPAAPENVRK